MTQLRRGREHREASVPTDVVHRFFCDADYDGASLVLVTGPRMSPAANFISNHVAVGCVFTFTVTRHGRDLDISGLVYRVERARMRRDVDSRNIDQRL